jgi:maleate isomerase
MQDDFEYGSAGIVGIAPPQSNPTVEPEFVSLMPADVTMLTTRLRGDLDDADKRFRDYLSNLEISLEGFGAIKLNAFGFACTATTYLLGERHVNREMDRLGDRFGYPMITSAQAIRTALAELGAKRIALFSPYPAWLQQASLDFWTGCGFELTSSGGVDQNIGNTLGIYRLRTGTIVEAVSRMDWSRADAIVLTGTGAPTLRAIPEISRRSGKPVFSSNLCLAWALLRSIGHKAALPVSDLQGGLIEGWVSREPQAKQLTDRVLTHAMATK